jgi:hypothetical protein
VAPDKLFSRSRGARQLLGIVASSSAAHNGGFFAWDGARVPW